jgi:hypothetical protein
MTLGKLGTLFKKNTRTKAWWIKLGVSLVLSNIFFFILFSSDSEVKKNGPEGIPQGWVEVQLNAELMTPFHLGKKVLLVHRSGRKKLEGVLQAPEAEQLGKITVLVKETEAHALFQYESWEVLPYLKHLTFASVKKDASHEIRY